MRSGGHDKSFEQIADHPLIQSVLTAEKEQTADSLKPIHEETTALQAREEALEASHKGLLLLFLVSAIIAEPNWQITKS